MTLVAANKKIRDALRLARQNHAYTDCDLSSKLDISIDDLVQCRRSPIDVPLKTLYKLILFFNLENELKFITECWKTESR